MSNPTSTGRICSKCNQFKTWEFFHKKGPHRYSSQCKKCACLEKKKKRKIKKRMEKRKATQIELIAIEVMGTLHQDSINALSDVLKEASLKIGGYDEEKKAA